MFIMHSPMVAQNSNKHFPFLIVNVGVIMLPNNAFSGCIVDAHMRIEIAHKDKGFL